MQYTVMPISRATRRKTWRNRITKPALGHVSKANSPQCHLKGTSRALKDTTTLTRGEIVDVLKRGPIRTKDLIASLKDKLRSDPSNKERLKEILKEVATVHGYEPDTSTTEKLLELKKDIFN